MQIIDYVSQGERPIELFKLLATIIAAYYGIRWSLKKTLSEKRWERKSDAYQKIIESLHHLKRVNKDRVSEEINQEELAGDYSKRLNDLHQKCYDELRKFIDIGALVISDEAICVLNQVQKTHEKCVDEWNSGNPLLLDLYETELEAAEIALEKIRSLAIKELK